MASCNDVGNVSPTNAYVLTRSTHISADGEASRSDHATIRRPASRPS